MTSKHVLGGVTTAVALGLTLTAAAGGAHAEQAASPTTSHLVIDPVSSPPRRLDISFGEVPGGTWETVITVTYRVVGCTPGEDVYSWLDPAYQDGRPLHGVFEGLGQGESTCGADGTASSGSLLYGDPKPVHPGWVKVTASADDETTGELLGSSTRWVRVPCTHRHHHHH